MYNVENFLCKNDCNLYIHVHVCVKWEDCFISLFCSVSKLSVPCIVFQESYITTQEQVYTHTWAGCKPLTSYMENTRNFRHFAHARTVCTRPSFYGLVTRLCTTLRLPEPLRSAPQRTAHLPRPHHKVTATVPWVHYLNFFYGHYCIVVNFFCTRENLEWAKEANKSKRVLWCKKWLKEKVDSGCYGDDSSVGLL